MLCPLRRLTARLRWTGREILCERGVGAGPTLPFLRPAGCHMHVGIYEK